MMPIPEPINFIKVGHRVMCKKLTYLQHSNIKENIKNQNFLSSNRYILVLHIWRKKVKNRPNLKMVSIFFPKGNLSGLFFYHTRDIDELKSEEFDNIVTFPLDHPETK